MKEQEWNVLVDHRAQGCLSEEAESGGGLLPGPGWASVDVFCTSFSSDRQMLGTETPGVLEKR